MDIEVAGSHPHTARRLAARLTAAVALTAVIAFAGVSIMSATATHRAGATTLSPKAINSGAVYSMNATGIKGEGYSGGPGAIEVNSFQWGVSRSTTASSAKAPSPSAFTITRSLDASSPAFWSHCVTGKALTTVTFYVTQPDDSEGDFMVITFTDVLITNVQWSGGFDDAAPMETLSMLAKSYKIAYTVGNNIDE